MSTPRCLALTGFDSFWGCALAERLLDRPAAPRVVGLDLDRPLRGAERADFYPIDLTDPAADARLAEVLVESGAEVLVHLAHHPSPWPSRSGQVDHGLETLGTQRVLDAVAAAGLTRLVMVSSTMLYGARPDNPNFLTEAHPLRGQPDGLWVHHRIEAETRVREWSESHPDTEVCVLRSCWALGPQHTDEITRFFSRAAVPTCLGHDPLMQFIHEQDLLEVMERATCESHPGLFNVVGRGVWPLSTLLAMAGRRRLPLPTAVLDRLPRLSAWEPGPDPPAAFYDYLRYLWIADGERGWSEFGPPRYTGREAWAAFVSAQRMEQYR
ncbi:MAG: NAD-dependent epimerase/dehydratase family protein [Myxococcota bacterium]